MIRTRCAVVSASPFGSSPSRRDVSAAIRTTACATARRRESGFAPTSTSRTSPDSPTCESSLTGGTLPWSRGRDAVQVREDRADPVLEVVLADVPPQALQALAPLRERQLERLVNRPGLAGHVERVHRQRPLAELLVRTRVLRQDQDA